jgi:hypothetical protein
MNESQSEVSVDALHHRLTLGSRCLRLDGKLAAWIEDEHPRDQRRRTYWVSIYSLTAGYPSLEHHGLYGTPARDVYKAIKAGFGTTDIEVALRRLGRFARELSQWLSEND